MRMSSPANSAASSPPAPARISTMTGRSSRGSRGVRISRSFALELAAFASASASVVGRNSSSSPVDVVAQHLAGFVRLLDAARHSSYRRTASSSSETCLASSAVPLVVGRRPRASRARRAAAACSAAISSSRRRCAQVPYPRGYRACRRYRSCRLTPSACSAPSIASGARSSRTASSGTSRRATVPASMSSGPTRADRKIAGQIGRSPRGTGAR